jgi:aminopeptidase N
MRNYFVYCIVSIVSFTCFHISAQNPCQQGKAAQAGLYYNRENLRSDTFNILKYTISLELGTSSAQQIKGNTQIRFAPKINGRTFIRFDLLKLVVDSVKENNQLRTYTYNDTVLKINFAAPKNTTDTSVFTVYYGGTPLIDATGWGGFYFNNTQGAQYAYNLGVGFGAKPHNYGRVWFPCFDNFVEKSKYEFFITTDLARKAHCNGQMVSDQVSGSNRVRHWVMNEEIPSYLAQVNAADYQQVNWTVNTLTGVKPITLVANALDTTAMKAGFVNLKNCIAGFENYFGPYRFNKFGYSLVPFNGGAMEHATNITYPRASAGVMADEYLYAHELSHHWWGDLVTCETPEDMWINEGMASYCADLFYEWQYGKAKAQDRIMSNHESLLHFLFKKEGWRSVSGVPHTLTYGSHVYEKGEDIAHTLRGYMGDSVFFASCKYVLQQKAFQNMNSNEFRDLLQTASGQSLSDYFTNWVFTTGWSHFAIDSVKYSQSSPSGSVIASVFLKQKMFGPAPLHSNVPLELSFFDDNWSRVKRKVVMSGATQSFTMVVPYQAAYTSLNFDGKINDASSHEYRTIKTTGYHYFAYGKLNMQVQSAGQDSSLLRIVHNFVRPDAFQNANGRRISDQHFWKIEGLMSPGFVAKTQFNYNGYKSTGGEFAYLDTLLTLVNGDSIALFYRNGAGYEWMREVNVTKTIVNAKSGYFSVDTLKLGEYAFASLSDLTAGLVKEKVDIQKMTVYPNPASNKVNVELSQAPFGPANIQIIALDGKVVHTQTYDATHVSVDLHGLAKGTYTIQIVQGKAQVLGTEKLIVD